MLARDLVASVIKTFFEELDDVRDGGEREQNVSPYGNLYATYFNKDRDWFIKANVTDITTFFVDDPIYKLEMLTELLYRDTRQLTDLELQGIMFRKIIELYDEVDVRSMEFSVERMNRVAELKKALL